MLYLYRPMIWESNSSSLHACVITNDNQIVAPTGCLDDNGNLVLRSSGFPYTQNTIYQTHLERMTYGFGFLLALCFTTKENQTIAFQNLQQYVSRIAELTVADKIYFEVNGKLYDITHYDWCNDIVIDQELDYFYFLSLGLTISRDYHLNYELRYCPFIEAETMLEWVCGDKTFIEFNASESQITIENETKTVLPIHVREKARQVWCQWLVDKCHAVSIMATHEELDAITPPFTYHIAAMLSDRNIKTPYDYYFENLMCWHEQDLAEIYLPRFKAFFQKYGIGHSHVDELDDWYLQWEEYATILKHTILIEDEELETLWKTYDFPYQTIFQFSK